MQVEKKGTKLGRLLFRNEIEFFYAVGIRRVNIHAGWESGGYTWARFGFLPDEDELEDDDFDILTRKQIKKRFNALQHILPEREKKRLAELVKLKRPRDLWELADRRTDMSSRLRTLFNDKAQDKDEQKDKKKILRSLTRVFGSATTVSMYTKAQWESLVALAEAKQPVPLGRMLLAGTDWKGYLDLDDPKQMQRAGRYIGGWKTEALANPPEPNPGL